MAEQQAPPLTIQAFYAEMLNEATLEAGRAPDALADIAAKRAILDEYVARDGDVDLMLGPNTLRQREWSGLRLAVRLLAAAYREHPHYRAEWSAGYEVGEV